MPSNPVDGAVRIVSALHAQLHHSINLGSRRLSVALYAYLDESGKFHDGTGFICLCGYLADDVRMKRFTRRWSRLLTKYNLPPVHMTDFFEDCRKAGYTRDEAKRIIVKFIDVIRTSRLFGFAVGVDGKHFRKQLTRVGRPNEDPAIFAIHRILHQMTSAAAEFAKDERPQLMLTFDEDEDYSIPCYKLISRLRKERPQVKSLIASISFAADDFFPPLQAADVLANLTNKYWRDRMNEESPEPSDLLRRLLTEPRKGIGVPMWRGSEFWNAKEIDKNLQALKLAKAMP
jgi:hypothetical protein